MLVLGPVCPISKCTPQEKYKIHNYLWLQVLSGTHLLQSLKADKNFQTAKEMNNGYSS